jgi:hypothetical protein
MNTVKSFISATALVAVAASSSFAQLGRQQGLVDPNYVPDSTLSALPYMTPAIVEAIKSARPILSIVTLDSLLGANGVGKPQRDSLYRKMFIHVDLNRGTDAEYMLIPGAGARMTREFKEYRPWTSYAQFAREIGKYVRNTPGEVERLEQYTFIPIDINTAPDSLVATFAPIGVGTRRWIREFAEYRPWTSKEQFDREIGKYVRNNPKEVQRLWRYVIIK